MNLSHYRLDFFWIKRTHQISDVFNRLVFMAATIGLFLVSCAKEQEPQALMLSQKTVLQNIVYGLNTDTSGTLQYLKLDLYLPAKQLYFEKYPVVLMIHGGSYLVGNKEWLKESCEILADSGFIAVSIDYRLGWRLNGGCTDDKFSLEEAQYKGMQDANAVKSFLVINAEKYNIDPEWIFVGGESAGAAIALNSSYTTDADMELHHPNLVKKLGRLWNPGTNLSDTIRIKGICNQWGAISDSSLIKTNNAIPVINFHGSADSLIPSDTGYFLGCPAVPAFGSMCIYRQLLAFNTASIVYLKQGGGHQPVEYSPAFNMSRTAAFFRQIMEGKAQSALYME